MEQQEITTIETTQAEIEEGFFQFADLNLTGEQLAEIKGGPGWCSQCVIIYSNHNETTADDDAEADELDDLPVSDEVDAEVKGGPKLGQGDVILSGPNFNHNETTAEDEEAETESLDDLPVEDDEQVKGGPSGGITKLGNKLLTL